MQISVYLWLNLPAFPARRSHSVGGLRDHCLKSAIENLRSKMLLSPWLPREVTQIFGLTARTHDPAALSFRVIFALTSSTTTRLTTGVSPVLS